MRKIRVIALVALSLLSTASLAAAQTSAEGSRARREHVGPGPRMEGRGGRGLLRGIKLSDAEKAKVKQIHEKYRTEGKALRESLRPAMEAARAARQKGDTAAARAAWNGTQADRDKVKALMERERAEIRAALTPENQKQFDANVQQLAQRRAEWKKNGGPKGRGGFRGHRAGQAG